MAVRLLAGPFVLRDKDGDIPTYAFVRSWWPGVGLIMDGNFTNAHWLCVATLDGICAKYATHYISHSWSWWPKQQRMVFFAYGGSHGGGLTEEVYEYVLEPISFFFQHTHPNDQPEVGAEPRHQYVKLADRRIYLYYGPRIYRQINGLPDAPESDVFPFPFSLNNWTAVHAGKNETEVFVSDPYASGRGPLACFYDTVRREISSPYYYLPMACNGLFYAPEYDVMVSDQLETTEEDAVVRTIRIWSFEVEPTTITPALPFHGTAKAGQVVTYRVRVTGDDDDAAVGELVNWTVIGTGMLLDPQSKVDAEGYATARVQYGLTESGPSMVTASVLC